MLFLGIDPGLEGGLCVLGSEGIVEVLKMPKTTRPHRKGNYIDVNKVYNFINKYTSGTNKIGHISIERQFILRSQGMSSGSKTMYQFGLLYGLCFPLAETVEEVNAKDWQNIIFPKIDKARINTSYKYNETKLKSIAYVEQHYNASYLFNSKRQTKPSDGLADAICIAAAALYTYNKQ